MGWFGLVWFGGRFRVLRGRWVGLLHHGYFSFSFSDRSLRVLVQVLFCRFRSFLPSHLFYCSLLTFFHFHFCHFFFSFTSFLFFFTFLLSLWSQVCVRCIKCIYISLGLFFLLLFFTSFLYLLFFFPFLSLSLSVTRSLCIFRYLNNIHANEQNKIESRSEYARSAVSPCSRFTLF